MRIVDIFSKRQKRLNSEILDIFVYDTIPNKLRVQIVHIIDDCISSDKSHYGSYSKNIYNL